MIGSGRTKLAAFTGLILVFITVLLFMWFFPNQESLHWTSLFFILLGEALPIAGFIWVEDSMGKAMGPGLRVGVYSLFFVYGISAVSMALILLFMNVKASLLAVLQIVLALAFGAIMLFAAALGGDKSRSRAKTMAAVSLMRGLEQNLSEMALDPANHTYKAQLRQIEEAVRYSDYSGETGIDEALAEKIRELKYVLLEDSETGAITNPERDKQVGLLTEDLLRLIRGRNRELMNKKKARNFGNG